MPAYHTHAGRGLWKMTTVADPCQNGAKPSRGISPHEAHTPPGWSHPQDATAPRSEVTCLPCVSWLDPGLKADSPPGWAESRGDVVQGRGDAQDKRQPCHALRVSCPRPIRAAGGAAPPTAGKMLDRSPHSGAPESEHEAENSPEQKNSGAVIVCRGTKKTGTAEWR